jgi:hypothetical protein
MSAERPKGLASPDRLAEGLMRRDPRLLPIIRRFLNERKRQKLLRLRNASGREEQRDGS